MEVSPAPFWLHESIELVPKMLIAVGIVRRRGNGRKR